MKDQFMPIEAYKTKELREMNLEPTRFCVQTLLPQGLAVLGGSPKTGKSWLVLDLCIQIAKGENIWDLQTTQGTTFYLCLEDTYQSILERIDAVTDEMPDNTYFAPQSESIQNKIQTVSLEETNETLKNIDHVLDRMIYEMVYKPRGVYFEKMECAE